QKFLERSHLALELHARLAHAGRRASADRLHEGRHPLVSKPERRARVRQLEYLARLVTGKYRDRLATDCLWNLFLDHSNYDYLVLLATGSRVPHVSRELLLAQGAPGPPADHGLAVLLGDGTTTSTSRTSPALQISPGKTQAKFYVHKNVLGPAEDEEFDYVTAAAQVNVYTADVYFHRFLVNNKFGTTVSDPAEADYYFLPFYDVHRELLHTAQQVKDVRAAVSRRWARPKRPSVFALYSAVREFLTRVRLRGVELLGEVRSGSANKLPDGEIKRVENKGKNTAIVHVFDRLYTIPTFAEKLNLIANQILRARPRSHSTGRTSRQNRPGPHRTTSKMKARPRTTTRLECAKATWHAAVFRPARPVSIPGGHAGGTTEFDLPVNYAGALAEFLDRAENFAIDVHSRFSGLQMEKAFRRRGKTEKIFTELNKTVVVFSSSAWTALFGDPRLKGYSWLSDATILAVESRPVLQAARVETVQIIESAAQYLLERVEGDETKMEAATVPPQVDDVLVPSRTLRSSLDNTKPGLVKADAAEQLPPTETNTTVSLAPQSFFDYLSHCETDLCYDRRTGDEGKANRRDEEIISVGVEQDVLASKQEKKPKPKTPLSAGSTIIVPSVVDNNRANAYLKHRNYVWPNRTQLVCWHGQRARTGRHGWQLGDRVNNAYVSVNETTRSELVEELQFKTAKWDNYVATVKKTRRKVERNREKLMNSRTPATSPSTSSRAALTPTAATSALAYEGVTMQHAALHASTSGSGGLHVGQPMGTRIHQKILGDTCKYCLVPRGLAAYTGRLYETFFSGCVPVSLSDHLEPPFSIGPTPLRTRVGRREEMKNEMNDRNMQGTTSTVSSVKINTIASPYIDWGQVALWYPHNMRPWKIVDGITSHRLRSENKLSSTPINVDPVNVKQKPQLPSWKEMLIAGENALCKLDWLNTLGAPIHQCSPYRSIVDLLSRTPSRSGASFSGNEQCSSHLTRLLLST
ncbi:unnamed protein product, partial [Amoebophrya sp. A120]